MKSCIICNIEIQSPRRLYCSSKCGKKSFVQNDKLKHLVQQRRSHIKVKFNLSWDTYIDLYNKQDGCCWICKTKIQTTNDLSEHRHVARIDHCHKTGKIRGLLCNECNKGLGCFKDDIEFLKQAINYLEKVED